MKNKEKLINIGIISISDRAFKGIYTDKGIPTIKNVLNLSFKKSFKFQEEIIPDEQKLIENTIIKFSDKLSCDLILTTGGTGPSHRDVTPDATTNVCNKILPGFGELLRRISYEIIETSIVSRQTAGIRNNSLIVNFPGNPKSIEETLPSIINPIMHTLDLLKEEK
ncbi:MAG: molybdopterin adenylyltransferase [Chloroflexi bacterium]|nr:molybdopterin adenylyltransferase [Chloroflexota bacterium]|tara:strand:- start:1982 stop:2479 length:498 start_codon:yes stop_codon:yes gene_type:complete